MSEDSSRSGVVGRIGASLRRDSGLSLAQKVKKGARWLAATASAPIRLRACDRVGPGTRTIGAPLIENFGSIAIGARAILNSSYVPVRLHAGPNATISFGDDAIINFGVTVSARAGITLGDRVSFGPYVRVLDHDGDTDAAPAAITIGSDVWLATRVTVKKGASIGDGSVVTAGSVVEGAIPAGVIAGGVPARVIGRRDGKPLEVPHASTRPAAKVSNGAAKLEPVGEVAAKPADMRGVVISDSVVQDLEQALRAPDELGTSLEVEIAPFGQIAQSLHGLAFAQEKIDFAFVWTRPQSIASFAALLDGKTPSAEAIDAEVEAFADLIKRAAKGARFVLVATWALPPYHRGFGMRDMKKGGAALTLARMNAKLAELLEPLANVHVLDASRWNQARGAEGATPKLWYLAKVEHGPEVLAEAALDIKAALRGVRGQAKKLVVLDLDDTLWGGIVGDVGWQNLRLGGHDGLGEAFKDFQRELKGLTKRGIALALVSKNEQSVALEAFTSHPEMVLELSDIVAYRINWIDKAKNVAEIAAELNLGLQSVVFLDDNPVERARVREALPEVYVPEWPKDPMNYVRAFLSLRCFDVPVVSQEDAERTQQYAAEKKREQLRTDVGSIDDWLSSLGIRVKFARLGPSNLARTTQLLNKTNQMNLSTRRLSEVELSAWAESSSREVWAVVVSDKFGDAGLTGIMSLEVQGKQARIVDYVLSCRVMGRKVEETLVAAAAHRARARGATEVVAKYLPTAKNKPCFGFWKGSGFAFDEAESTFRWDASAPFPFPTVLAVEGLEGDAATTEVTHA
jgi:FkbH-like protein